MTSPTFQEKVREWKPMSFGTKVHYDYIGRLFCGRKRGLISSLISKVDCKHCRLLLKKDGRRVKP